MYSIDNPNYYSVSRPYKPKMICCNCRKVFKRRLIIDIAPELKLNETEMVCPNCGKPANYIGPKFRAPKSDNIQAWKSLEVLQRIGTLHFMGFAHDRVIIPESKKGLNDLLKMMKLQCEYWIRRWVSYEYDPNNKEQIRYFSDTIKRIDKQLKK